MSEEPYMHWEDVLRFLADRDAQIERLKAENDELREQKREALICEGCANWQTGQCISLYDPGETDVDCFNRRDLRTMLADLTGQLHDLTPMGSEFVDNPDRCIDWIEQELSTRLAACVRATAARNKLEKQLAEALAERDRLCNYFDQWGIELKRRQEAELERDKAIAEAASLRRVAQGIYDDWTGRYAPEEFAERYGIDPANNVDEAIDIWLLNQLSHVIASTTLAEEHLAKDRNRDEALLEIRDYSDNEGYANYQVDEMKRIARRALGEETK